MSEKSRVLKTISVNNSNKNENENERRNKKIGRDFDEAMKRNPIGITQCLMGATHERNLADEACQDGKYKKAVKHYLEAMEKLDEGFEEESYQHVESIIGLCEAYIGLKDWKSVEKFAFRLLKIAADYECYETVQTAKELLEIGKNKGATAMNEVETKEVKIDEEKTDENKPTNCASCNALNAKFRCSSCKSVNYCSKECQASDWRTHKSQCSANKAQSSVGKDPSKPVCGLCGFEGSRTIKIIKTDCCNNWICQDQQNYEISSFKLNSCQRNHQRYTLCSTHCEEKHQGKFSDCHVCQPSYRCFHADSEEERAWKKFTYKHFYFENVGDKERKRNRELKRDGTKAFMVQIPFGGR